MILDEIIERTRARVSLLPNVVDIPAAACSSPGRLEKALHSARGRNAIIAEIKYASPSRGLIRNGYGPEELTRIMAEGGAVALSVLTEPVWFKGSPDYLSRIRKVTGLPLLQKDFIIDRRQIIQGRLLGADAVLLIAGVLGEQLPEFVRFCRACSVEPLVEIHSPKEIPLAAVSGATLIGINNRDLTTMETNLDTTRVISEKLGMQKMTLISMSGICWPYDIRYLRKYCDAFLVGSSIMASADPGSALEGFVSA